MALAAEGVAGLCAIIVARARARLGGGGREWRGSELCGAVLGASCAPILWHGQDAAGADEKLGNQRPGQEFLAILRMEGRHLFREQF